MQQLVKKNPQCPYINRTIIKLLKNELGSHIIVGAAYGLPLLIDIMSSPPEITQLHITQTIHKNILRLNRHQSYLNIPMHDIIRVQVLHSGNSLYEVFVGFNLAHASTGLMRK